MTLVVDLCSRPLSRREFVDPIASIAGAGALVARYTEVCLEDADAAGAVVLTGCALRDMGYLEDLDALRWVTETRSRVLGICAGMQVIGLLRGASLTDCKEIGMTRVEVVKPNPLMDGPFEAYELHAHGLEVPGDLEVLAVSDSCVQAIADRQSGLWGILFHPEVRRHGVVHRFLEMGEE